MAKIMARDRSIGQAGRSYNGQFRKRVAPASAQERIDSMYRRMNELVDMLAGETNPAAIESLSSQIAFQQRCIDNAEAAR